MHIDRRRFLFGAALVVGVPAVAGLWVRTSGPSSSRPVFRIAGWDVPAAGPAAADEVWITLGRSWRTAWR